MFKTLLLARALGIFGTLLAALAAGLAAPPHIQELTRPNGGQMQLIFHGEKGPFKVEKKLAVEDSWTEVPEALVTEMQPRVYVAVVPRGVEERAFYRVVSESDPTNEIISWALILAVSSPVNGHYFEVGESPVVTVRIVGTEGNLTRNSFSSFNLYMHGPQNPRHTKTAVKLLNASTNRTVSPHHYVDLKTNPDATVTGDLLTYRLKAVTDETPGTYTVSLFGTLAADPRQQTMEFADVQIRTATVEQQVVEAASCATCHSGPVSRKIYLHHIDPGRSPVGNWALDMQPTRSCKACHNNEGYAAVKTEAGEYINDHILRRVHGVHLGGGLRSAFNTNQTNGDFMNYRHVNFPADVRNCTTCHKNDRWKDSPSRLGCGTCHDNTWFGPVQELPLGMTMHSGGTRILDSSCARCHPPELEGYFEDYWPVANEHKVPAPGFPVSVEMAMTTPANGVFYRAGETPRVVIKVKDAATGLVINPTEIREPLVTTNIQSGEWRRGYLYVSGPRANTKPVLTSTAAVGGGIGMYASNDLRVRVDPLKEDARVSRSEDAVSYQLSDVAGLVPGTYTVFVEFQPSTGLGGTAFLNFQVGTEQIEKEPAGNCKDCHGETRMHATTLAVEFKPDVCKSCHDNLHQVTGKTGWNNFNNGFGAAPLSRRVHGVHFGNYLEKPAEVHRTYDFSHVIFPQDVRNCTKCHADSASWRQNPTRLACLSCHDSEATEVHASVMTLDPTMLDPWSGDEVETCIVCHGEGSRFGAAEVHSLSDPYVPPYPRAPR